MTNATQPPVREPTRHDAVHPLLTWAALVAAGLLLSALAVLLDARLGTASAPFTGAYRAKLTVGSALAPLVAVGVLTAVRRGVHLRLPWPTLLRLSWLAAVAWTVALAVVDGGNGLASPVASPDEYLADVAAVGGDPGRFLSTFVARSDELSIATRQHPPGPVLLLWALGHLGLTRPAPLGVLVTAVGCLTVPLVAVALRGLCGEAAARALLPALVLAPWAVWVAVSMDAITSALLAGAVAAGVSAAGRRRADRAGSALALAAGLLLGCAALMSYSAGWLGLTVVVVYFVRRRARLNVVSGLGALIPLGLARTAGFVWPDGLTAAQVDFSERVGPERSWLLWAPLDVLILVIVCGPVIVLAARRARRSSGWPFLVGALLAVGFALGSGLSRGEVERSWLPFFPWLLVAAVAPRRGDPADAARTLPWPLLAVGAAVAVVVEAVLRTAW